MSPHRSDARWVDCPTARRRLTPLFWNYICLLDNGRQSEHNLSEIVTELIGQLWDSF
jgi:hypothetical protein